MDLKPFNGLEKAKFEHKEGKKPFNVLMEMPDRPGYIIKESTDRTWWGNGEEKLAKAHIVKNYITKIESNEIGISKHIPRTEIILGQKGKNENAIFTIQEKIEGGFINKDNAKRAFEENPEGEIAQAVRDIGEIVKGVIELYLRTFSNGEGSSVEISKIRNFIYGINVARPELSKTVYLVDFIPVYVDEPMHIIRDVHELLADYPMLTSVLEEDLQKLEALKPKN